MTSKQSRLELSREKADQMATYCYHDVYYFFIIMMLFYVARLPSVALSLPSVKSL